jgi:hypothetical protein
MSRRVTPLVQPNPSCNGYSPRQPAVKRDHVVILDELAGPAIDVVAAKNLTIVPWGRSHSLSTVDRARCCPIRCYSVRARSPSYWQRIEMGEQTRINRQRDAPRLAGLKYHSAPADKADRNCTIRRTAYIELRDGRALARPHVLYIEHQL